MRVTDKMISNNMMININKNSQNLNQLNQQLSSTKKIQVPSDNPILAARTLKFRTNIGEAEQYKRNVGQGLSWMSATDKAFYNITELHATTRTLAEKGTSGENTADERKIIATEIKQLMEQFGTEMRTNYAGRSIFSGYRTNQFPVFDNDNDLKYNINQVYNIKDIEVTESFQKLSPTSEPFVVEDINLIKLPYTFDLGEIPNLSIKIGANNYKTSVTVGTDIIEKTILEGDAYTPDDNGINFIKETGEVVLGKNVHTLAQTEDIQLNYDKTGFKKGDLNPMVYFDCTDRAGKTFKKDGQNLKYEFSVNTRININSLAKDIYTDKMYSDLRELYQFTNSVATTDADKLREELRPAFANEQDLENAVQDQVSRENAEINAVLYDRFNNLIGNMDKHFTNISREQADMGSRMKRLELIEAKIDEDKINFQELLSENEDANMVELSIALSSAQVAYNAALKAGAGIIQMTLADFIR